MQCVVDWWEIKTIKYRFGCELIKVGLWPELKKVMRKALPSL